MVMTTTIIWKITIVTTIIISKTMIDLLSGQIIITIG